MGVLQQRKGLNMTAGELKFKLALEDEGVSWEQAETILGFVEDYLLSEYIEKTEKARGALEEVNLAAYSARHTVERWDNGLLDDLEALSKPLPDGERERVGELRGAISVLVFLYRHDAQEVTESVKEIEEM